MFWPFVGLMLPTHSLSCIIFERDGINIQFADLMIEHILFLSVADESLLSYETELLWEVCVYPAF